MIPATLAHQLSQVIYQRRERDAVAAELAKLERLVMTAIQTGAFHVELEMSSLKCQSNQLVNALEELGYRCAAIKRGLCISWGAAG